MPARQAPRFLVLMALVAALQFAPSAPAATGELMSTNAFLDSVFDTVPEADATWLTGARGETARRILGHSPTSLRQRYWRDGETSAWIFDEIGKERPITIGVAVHDGRIRSVRILHYREPRGWEVQHGFFTEQFDGATLDDELDLDRSIDGISGATLSVQAVTRVSRLALALHRSVTAAR